MKKKFITFLIFSILFSNFFIFKAGAVTTTPTPTPTSTNLQQKAQRLLDLVASDTAKLNLTEKRGIIGKVTDATTTQITVDDINGNTRFIDVDELTKFTNPAARGSFGISDIEKGSTIGVLGLYNKSSRRILARFVDVTILPHFVHGTVTAINNPDFNFTVVTDENKSLTIDVTTVTKTSSYTLLGGLIKSGFSKIIEKENVVVIGYPDKKDTSIIIPSYIILLLELPANPAIEIPGSKSSGQILPSPTSTRNGKTLTPIVK